MSEDNGFILKAEMYNQEEWYQMYLRMLKVCKELQQEIKSLKDNVMVCMLDSDYEFVSTITNKEIKTIVTHEQMEQMAYKVGE